MFKSILKPESGIAIGVIEAIAVYEIYKNAMPSATAVRNAPAHDSDVEGTRKNAAVKSAALVAVVFLLSRDLNAFIIGGSSLVGIDFLFKHNNAINPSTGRYDTSGSGQSIAPGMDAASDNQQPLPDYSETDSGY